MELKHTKGEWYVNRDLKHTVYSSINGFTKIADVNPFNNLSPETQEEAIANAKLIAAATDLLEALIRVKSIIENSDEWWMYSPSRGGFDLELIENAIKKATE